jgi:hypothetical protein
MLLAVAGGLGGGVVGGLLSLMLLHLKVAHSVEINSLGMKVLLTLVGSIIAGMIAPRFFMMYFLSPLSWLMDARIPLGEGIHQGISMLLGRASYSMSLTWLDCLYLFSGRFSRCLGLSE